VRFELGGRSLWYGTPDAPAPLGIVTAGAGHEAAGVTVTVGVQPLNASYRVEVHYRVNGGAPVKVPAVLFRTDVRASAQYFSARLPNLHVGDKVEYGALCAIGSVQLPQPGPPHVLAASFHVVGPDHAEAKHAAMHAVTAHHAAAASHAAPAHAAAHPGTHGGANGAPPHSHGSPTHGSHTVEGIVTSPGRGPLAGIFVEIIDKNVGSHASLATATTDDHGHYKASYTPPGKKAKPDICARAFAGQTLLGVSSVRYNAGTQEKLGISVPANAEGLPSEYESLTAAITKLHAGKLGDLKESAQHDDITYLAKKTGWDARAIVFAAVADQLAHGKHPTMRPELYYALFRAGFSTEPDALYASSVASATGAWTQAAQAGIIPKSLATSVDGASKSFESLCATHLLDEKPRIGLSSLREVLQVTLGNDSHRAQTFADLHVRYGHDLTAFWNEVQKSFGPDLTKRLQLDGKLAHLTLNNAPLMRALHGAQGKSPIASVDDLAWRGFYQPVKWTPLIGGAIPKEIAGGTPDHRRPKYAEYLAAQVRLASPLAVVADMVATGALPLSPGTTAADKAALHAFFLEHNGRFSMGGEPVERYLSHNLSAPYSPSVIAQIKRLQRVYQITPDDQAFAALLRHGLDSAYAVTRYDPAGFARAFGHDLGGASVAAQVHAKARVVAAAALQIAISRLAARGAHAGMAALAPARSEGGALVVSPTMEQLFGSMDFCDCSECRSILSPAAYLVDLLNFVDYPPAGKKNPQTVLLERRPDLQYLPLTCDNTNVALPYIDLVNETLEYFVANRLTLTDFHGHTTDGKLSSDELMASPQFVQDSAYTTLKGSLFPLPLPFDRPLELLRLHFAAIGPALHAVMAALQTHDARDSNGGGSPSYGWSDILMERVGLSRAEYRLLTDGSPTLRQVFGYPEHDAAAAAPRLVPIAAHSPAPPHAAAPVHSPAPVAAHTPAPGPTHALAVATHPAQSSSQPKDAAILSELSNLQTFCRRVGIAYEDLAEIVRTHFINPATGLRARVEALSVPFEVIQLLKAGQLSDAAFVEQLPAGLDPVAYGAHPAAHKRDYGPIVAWVKDDANYARMMSLVTIAKAADADDTCSAATLRLAYANPDPARHDLRAVDFVRLLRFIRLWRKLGLSIRQTDALVTALYPAEMALDGKSEADDGKHLDAGFTTLLARIGFLFQVIDLLSLSTEHDLPALLACWAPIGTDGHKSLYAKMFLTPSLLRQDAAFAEDPNGNVLLGSAKIFDHEPALRSALHLRGAEFGVIADALGFSATTPLTLENVTAIYRRGWLARTLRLSVVELLATIQCTGIDPFAPLDLEEAPNGAAAPRRPPPMVRFARLVQSMRDAGLKPAQALYLLWNRDISGKSSPSDAVSTSLARSLRADAAGIESQFALVDDPKGDIAKNLMALAYGSDATDLFFSLIEGTLPVSVPYSQPDGALPDAVVAAGQGRLTYDDLRKTLSYAGVLDDASLPALNSAAAGNAAILTAIAALSKANHRVVDPFFASNPTLKAPYAAYVASTDPAPMKRKALLAATLPDLKRRKREEQALATVTAAAGTDPTFATALLCDATVLASAGSAESPSLADFTAVGDGGLTARFFSSNDPSGTPDVTVDEVATMTYGAGGANTLPGGGASPIAAEWRGFVEVPKAGFYDIAVATDAGATVALDVGGTAVTLAQGPEGWSNQTPLELRAGTLVPITLRVTSLKTTMSLRWMTTGLAWQVIPSTSLYSAAVMDRMATSYVRFLKATSLASGLSLTANEMAHLAASDELKVAGHGWLGQLVTHGLPPPEASGALTSVLSALLDFARIKAAISPSDESWLAVLRDPDATLPGGGSALVALTQWDPSSVSALLTHFFGSAKSAPLARLEGFRRVYDAYAIVTACGISAASLVKGTTNDPTPADAAHLPSALRAQYADSDWFTLVKPINDTMRAKQRDALVAYVLHHLKQQHSTQSIDTPDRLFEYLLMDVEMAPCGQTSRVRLALSSIQLFIERALRSLEPEVDPSHLSADQWEWMKNYRVWQANREVFLWPENWLDPELRDDQSPIFKETMGELLQGEITEDGAASALLSYLAKLHDVAKLEPCGVVYDPGDPAAAGAVTHVISRTAGTVRKYHYRRQENGGWTPWDEVKTGIDDNPVVPILWNHRLVLFWVQIIQQTPDTSGSSSDSDSPPPKPKMPTFEELIHWSKTDWKNWNASVARYDAYEKAHKDKPDQKKLVDSNVSDVHQAAKSSAGDPSVTIQAVLCWSEYHDGQWLPANTSDPNAPATLGIFPPHGPQAFDRSTLRLRAAVRPDGALLVHLSMGDAHDQVGSGFLLYNTRSVPLELAQIPAKMLHSGSSERLASYVSSALRIDYRGSSSFTRDLLSTQLAGRAIESQPGTGNAWNAPFFYEDSKNVFLVTSEELHEPLGKFKGFGFHHPSGVGHAGTVHHFPAILAPHQPPLAHSGAAATPVPYQGILIGPTGPIAGHTGPAEAGATGHGASTGHASGKPAGHAASTSASHAGAHK
jgi:hypothetical protein